MNNNIFPAGITDAEFRKQIINLLLGADWYVVEPMNQRQVNEIALQMILEKYT